MDLVVHIALAVWMGVWLFAKWQQNVTQSLRGQSGGSPDGVTDELDPNNQDY